MSKVLIIGATSVIAEHCARIWAARGDELFLVARKCSRLEIIAADLRVRGATQVVTYCTDLNDMDRHTDLIDSADEAMNGVSHVLIAHGALSDQKVCERDVKEALTSLATNSISVVSLLTLIANRFETRREGTICVISSVAGDRGRASNYYYGSAKALVSAFTSGLRQRLASAQVAVVTVKPGFVDTPMTANFKKGVLWVGPRYAALKIVKAIDKKQSEVYVPAFWRYVSLIIKALPMSILVKFKL